MKIGQGGKKSNRNFFKQKSYLNLLKKLFDTHKEISTIILMKWFSAIFNSITFQMHMSLAMYRQDGRDGNLEKKDSVGGRREGKWGEKKVGKMK